MFKIQLIVDEHGEAAFKPAFAQVRTQHEMSLFMVAVAAPSKKVCRVLDM